MELFKIFGTIALKGTEDVNKGLDGTSSKAGKLASAIGSGLKTAAKVGIAAVTAAAGVVGTLATAAVKNYAEYEQLVGGVETLFKDSSGKLMEYANNAYQTAGLSANAYMEQATSFSASLLQGLAGDTEAAVEYANLAITDMSDNANKMGTSIDLIQNAYQGFAKQNYTMLDNLKLGYGGTASEMARLINDSGVLGNTMKVTAKTVNQVSFDKIIEAIHVVQTEMGITGTTAAEASSTISGSIGMMKAAWTNLTVGLAGDSSKLSGLIGNFVSSAKTVVSNVIPVFTQVLAGIGQLVTELAPVITTALPQIVTTVLPSLLAAAMTLVQGLVMALTQMAPSLVTAAVALIGQLVQFLVDNLPMLIDSTIEIIMALIDGIVQFLPLLITAAVAIISELAVKLTDPGTLTQLVMAALAILGAVCQGIFQNLPVLIQAAIQIITQLVEFLISPDNLAMIIQEAATLVMALATGLLDAAFQLVIAAGELVGTIIETILGTDWLAVGHNIVSSIAEGFGAAWNKFKSWISGETDSLGTEGGGSGNGNSGGGAPGRTDPTGVRAQVQSHAKGLDFVPYDEYPAFLHKGEMVLPANQADYIRSGKLAESNEQVVAVLIKILDALEHQDMSININKREFGRLVKGVT